MEMGMQLRDMGENNEMRNSARRCHTIMKGRYCKEKFSSQEHLNVGC
jgi:hypothetical protein